MKNFLLPRNLKGFDWGLFFVSLLLLGLGLLSIYSATKSKSFSHGDFYKQLVFVIPGLIACFSAAFFDYYKIRNYTNYIYWGNIGLLLFVMFAGHSAYGAQRWIVIGGITIQPSEMAKIALIITLADLLIKKRPETFKDLLPIFLHCSVPIFLIFRQPDLGTSLSLVAIVMGMLYASHISVIIFLVLISPAISALFFLINFPLWLLYLLLLLAITIYFFKNNRTFGERKFQFLGSSKYFMVPLINLFGGLFTSFVWNNLLEEYQKKRISVFLNPEVDPLGSGYHISQSKIAIGSGGFFGKGLFEGTQTQLNFIPFQHTDFIFVTISEELGLIGGLYILLLFLYIIWRGLIIANNASDEFGKYVGVGIVTMFAFHIFVNIGMISGILPAKGLPLPLMSYGGTFLVITLFAVGMLESICIRKKRLIFSDNIL